MSIYKEILERNIPRLLNLFNIDVVSPTYGHADRLYWGWKVIDFNNGTFQGAVHALSIAYRLGIFKEKDFLLRLVDSSFQATAKTTERNGSLGEAYPNESSFCVTALVAFDLLSAIKHLGDDLDEAKKKEYLRVVRPLIGFITKNDEEHAIISNHLATGVAAITLWNRLSGEENGRWKELLNVIYSHQSKEGWYREYEGADPGYQTLCIYYLASALEDTQDEELKSSLSRSLEFLKYFIHPDGTIGGLYGSRNTEVYYPGGIVALNDHSDAARILKSNLENGIVNGNQIVPDSIDANNLIPLINSYAFAAFYEEQSSGGQLMDAPHTEQFSKQFDEAGIYVHSNEKYYTIVNFKKGGTVKVFDKNTASIDTEDGGLFGNLANGQTFSTQQFDDAQDFSEKIVKASFYKVSSALPTPLTIAILRIMSITVFRSTVVGNWFKKFIVNMLMTGKEHIAGGVERQFEFGDDKIVVTEKITEPSATAEIGHYGFAKAIHMASSGYVNRQKLSLIGEPRLIEFKRV